MGGGGGGVALCGGGDEVEADVACTISMIIISILIIRMVGLGVREGKVLPLKAVEFVLDQVYSAGMESMAEILVSRFWVSPTKEYPLGTLLLYIH